jgi:hypothetical protein
MGVPDDGQNTRQIGNVRRINTDVVLTWQTRLEAEHYLTPRHTIQSLRFPTLDIQN